MAGPPGQRPIRWRIRASAIASTGGCRPKCKQSAVLRLLRGEELELVSRGGRGDGGRAEPLGATPSWPPARHRHRELAGPSCASPRATAASSASSAPLKGAGAQRQCRTDGETGKLPTWGTQLLVPRAYLSTTSGRVRAWMIQSRTSAAVGARRAKPSAVLRTERLCCSSVGSYRASSDNRSTPSRFSRSA